MFSKSSIPPGLIQAYRETHYLTRGSEDLCLRVDQPNPNLISAQQRHQSDCSAFITACNPFSAELSDQDNAERQADLATHLQSLGLTFIEGIGQHPTNSWDGEPSFLVFGLSLETATELCIQLEQNGFIWSGADGIPRLILVK